MRVRIEKTQVDSDILTYYNDLQWVDFLNEKHWFLCGCENGKKEWRGLFGSVGEELSQHFTSGGKKLMASVQSWFVSVPNLKTVDAVRV